MSRPKILVTGPESSGTKYVAALLEYGGGEVLHRSQPNGYDWLDLGRMLDEPSSGYDSPMPPMDWVIITIRGLMAHTQSMIRRNIETSWETAESRRRAALGSLDRVLGDPRVVVVTYESLAHQAERVCLLEFLGLNTDAAGAEDVAYHDQNWKYYQ
jgi:hypothetical protein